MKLTAPVGVTRLETVSVTVAVHTLAFAAATDGGWQITDVEVECNTAARPKLASPASPATPIAAISTATTHAARRTGLSRSRQYPIIRDPREKPAHEAHDLGVTRRYK